MRVWIVCLVIVAFGCGPEEEVRIQLTPDQRDAYLAIAGAELDSLRPQLDSLCAATFETRVATATDSIVQLRLEEELRLRARLQREGP